MFRRAFLRTLKRLISCSFFLQSIMVFMLILGRSNISSSPKSVLLYCLYKFQNCVSFGMFSESNVSITTTIRCFTFRQEFMVFYQRQGHICFFRWTNLSLECKPWILQIIFHTVLYAAISQKARVWCQLPRLRKHNQVRISLHIFWWL